ncbi:MAG TPA: DNA polymerase/3'-5' exonuclease PolX, partial [Desulfotignum sp.]|nr:DNA polymerase/3'-5' exonuclease PolX [Desulfotignum sp.]
MPVQNTDIAAQLKRMADLLEIEGANPFRVRAYRNAARTVKGLARPVADLIKKKEDLTGFPGIGRDLADKIKQIVAKGTFPQLNKIQGRLPEELPRLMEIEHLGPKRVKQLYQELGISSTEDLKAAAQAKKIRTIKGFGKKIEQSVLHGLEQMASGSGRILLSEAEERAAPLVTHMQKTRNIDQITLAGSFRRRKETVGDLDLLICSDTPEEVIEHFTAYADIKKMISRGETLCRAKLLSGLHVDLRVLAPADYAAGLHHFTGSKAHNIALRKRAVKKNLKINEYGIFKGEKQICVSHEKQIYEVLDLAFVVPELREHTGEIKAAEQDRLPRLIQLQDIKGDLHAHTTETDGLADLEEMVQTAQDMGYKYLAITDHSVMVRIANGMDARRLEKQIETIDALNDHLENFRVLKGVEVDIRADGSLDLPDDVLKKLDVRVCSIHFSHHLSRKKQTERIIKAMENPCFNILGHPTGRLINRRKPYAVDLEKIMAAAKENGCFMELNAQPDRLDLSDEACRLARDMGVKIAVSSDAHDTGSLSYLRLGIDQARRGWLERADVINTSDCQDLLQMM